ncbi:terpenoid synthase [Lindgomyces ingoldianus]|uniref:Terpenoid synthase n=1 Tax=Lindgomyces ingoldianus TaxID=673940 RepID=A0ACB6QI69_9PLEO|nr:terpenoid synthase [Lindgomyces ingoldianus]KAF2466571.1 terpenoid synthase [Lindgomyces ingoldianus]
MEYCYSKECNLKLSEAEGLEIDVVFRMHKDWAKEVKGTLDMQKEWNMHVSSIDGYNGGLGRQYQFMSATIPECLPERLEIISYANEFAFLYDDKLENMDTINPAAESYGLLDAFSDVLNQQSSASSRREKKLQAKILSKMMAIDGRRAAVMMNSWATFVNSAARVRVSPPDTLEEYIPARVIDAGELIWFGFITFGMALTIPDNEYEKCHTLAKPAYAALGLTNDLFSWNKERDAARRAGQTCVFNAIWVIMREKSVTEAEAKMICRAEIRRWISTYRCIVDNAKEDMSLSKDLRTYLEALLLSYVGNLVWSITCPRYNEYPCR